MHCSSEAAGFVRYFLGLKLMHMVLSQSLAEREMIGRSNISGGWPLGIVKEGEGIYS